ncbi:hypothetical protein GOP47_0001149 [Adiantum capillus-veneris]|uniref:Uncharacterized protein n=1 Tax=Adiantum capillus-veneris TaxID=13818 RepID=A0A9D4VF98_ADICA|nr:hypothetical protein GOP47_0001149 [Adiantum capillus-veneris]
MSELALAPRTPVLAISELSDAINFRFAFEGKVLSNDFVRIEGGSVRRRTCNDGGTSVWALYADATTLVVKDEPFDCILSLYPEHKIKDLVAGPAVDFVPTVAFTVTKIDDSSKGDGGTSYRLTIADGHASRDRASLLFVPSRRVDYHHMVNEVKANGSYACVAHNINIFKHLANTLSIVDATILCALPIQPENVFRGFLSKQLASLGFGKKIFSTLEVVNVNSLGVEYICESCKGVRVSRQASNPFCFTCDKVSNVLKVPSVQEKVALQNGSVANVTLDGKVVDQVLCLRRPFLELYDDNLVSLKSSLVNLKKVGTFTVDIEGYVS